MSDPRLESNWKQKRVDEKQLVLLGAILDALNRLAPAPLPKAEPPKAEQKPAPQSSTTRRAKSE